MSTTVAQLSADSKIAISLKKLQGKAHTKNDNELYNEGLPSGITMDSTTIFGVRPPENPSQDLNSITNDVVEKVRLVVEFIAGSDSTSGRHGFKLKLPSDYETNSTNPSKGTAPFVNDQVLVDSNGALQLVPPQYHYLYEAKPYYGTEPNLTQIPLADPRDWNLDYFNGVMFQQDPYGPGNDAQNPTFVDAYIYIGDYLDTVVGEGGGGGGGNSTATYITLSNNADLDNERVLSGSDGITIQDFGSNNNVALGIDDSIVATISGSTFTGDISAPNIQGTTSITSPALHGANLFLDDGTTETWIGGNNVEIVVDGTTGQRTINTLGGDSAFIATQAGYLNTTSSVSFAGDLGSTHDASQVGTDVFLFVSGSENDKSVFGSDVVISGSLDVKGGTNVGPVNYTDGYFDTIVNETKVGTALSQINDLLKQLAPAQAPNLSTINESFEPGERARVSFGTSLALANYSSHTTSGGFASVIDINGLFDDELTENTSYRVGVVGTNTTQIGGSVASNVTQNVHSNGVVNYPDRSLGNAAAGTIRIELNGNILHSIDLSDSNIGAGVPGSGTGIHQNVNNSGFVAVSAIGYGKFSNGETVSISPIRTMDWRINRTDWVLGYNFARVVHVVGADTYASGYIEWIYDGDTSSISVTGAQLESQNYSVVEHVTGVKYYSTGSVTYAARVENMYKNVYSAASNAIAFTVGESAVQSIEVNGVTSNAQATGLPVIDVNTETPDKILDITGSINLTPSTWLLNQSQTFGINLQHPLKIDISNGQQQSTSGILMFQDVSSATAVLEDFNHEEYRMNVGAYDDQSDITGASFDSTVDRTAGGHLLVQAGKLMSPLTSINGGNFLNTTDGGIVPNGPSSNVNYSGITGELTYYRKIQNNTGSTMFNLTMEIQGDALLVGGDDTLDGNKFKLFMKLPAGTKTNGETGWCDLTKDFYTGQYGDDAGLLRNKLDTTMPMSNKYTFGVNGVGINDWVIIKVVADASWTGYLSSISITWDTVRYVFNN